ncbi:MAG: SIMPL domain-containing protein [Cyanobacteria bacterium P01_F01_bin.143]
MDEIMDIPDPLTGACPLQSLNDTPGDLLTGSLTLVPTDPPNILEVTGQGIISVPTTTAQIQLGIEVEGDTASQVQQEIAQLSSAVVEQLNTLGVDDLQTISISLRPNLQFNQGQSTVVGFTGTNVLQFEVPTEQAGATIDAAIQAGANLIQNISFIAPDEAINQARIDAIALAIQDAQDQANSVFDTLDLQALEITDIDILGVSNPPSSSPFVDFEAVAFSVSTPILGGDQDVIASVALDINYI